MSRPRQNKDLLILIDRSEEYGRQVIRGILQHRPRQWHWRFHLGNGARVKRVLAETGMPVISFIGENIRDLAGSRPGPVVNVSSRIEEPGVPTVVPDHREVGRIAARHLRDTGRRHFAFVGIGSYLSDLKLQGMEEVLRESGHTVTSILGPGLSDRADWSPLWEFITSNPDPTGILLNNDGLARMLAMKLDSWGLRVPDDVGIVGVDDDPFFTHLQSPTLSSVNLNGEQVGLQAAALMERMLWGESVDPDTRIVLPPAGLIERESTLSWTSDNALLSTAQTLIRERACEGLTAKALAESIGVDPSYLRRCYLNEFNETPKAAIRRRQLAEACRLLRETDLKTVDVALAVGFIHTGRFSKQFRDFYHCTPGEYRRRSQVR